MSEPSPPAVLGGPRPGRDALLGFVLATAGIAIAGVIGRGVPVVQANLGAVAAVLFLFIPYFYAGRYGQDLYDYGFRADPIKPGLAFGFGIPIIVFPIFAFGFAFFYELVCHTDALRVLAPRGMCVRFGGLDQWHWPPIGKETAKLLFVQVIVVALPEEVFFRGFIQQLLERVMPPKRTLWGGRVGLATVLAALLFAVGHLAVQPDPRRLAVFFPGLMFGWVFSRTRSVMAGTIIHALSNVFINLLEKSF